MEMLLQYLIQIVPLNKQRKVTEMGKIPRTRKEKKTRKEFYRNDDQTRECSRSLNSVKK